MSNLAEKYIQDHNNPLVKIDLPGSKLFLSSHKKENEDLEEKCISTIESALKHERVDRRCARTKAVWLPDKNLAKVTKIAGSVLANFGYQDKNGKFLYPEETMYLMETNRLELTCNDSPVSIQEGYEMMLNNSDCDFKKYWVYKKLVSQGYKLSRKVKLSKNLDHYEPPNKIRKISEEKTGQMSNIFEKLRQNAPREFKSNCSSQSPDYFVFLPKNTNKTNYDFNLFISKNNVLDNIESNEDVNVYAICSDDVTFYRFANVTIPVL